MFTIIAFIIVIVLVITLFLQAQTQSETINITHPLGLPQSSPGAPTIYFGSDKLTGISSQNGVITFSAA